MNNLLVHRSHPRPQKGLTTISPAIIDDKEQTPMCGHWRWRIPKFQIAPAVRSLYFRLRGRTPVTLLKPRDNVNDGNNGQRSPTRENNRVEPVKPIVLSTNSSKCMKPATSYQGSPVASSSSISATRDVSTPSRFSLPGAVGESEFFATVRSDTSSHKSVSVSNSQTSEGGQPKRDLFCRPKYTCQSNSVHLIYQQQVGQSLNNAGSVLEPAVEAHPKESKLGKGSTLNMDLCNESDIKRVHVESVNTSSKEDVHHSVDILVITHSPSPSPISDPSSDVEINIQDSEQELNVDEVSEPRPVSRLGRECWAEQEHEVQGSPEGYLKEEFLGIGSTEDFNSKPDDADKEGIPLVKNEETTVVNDSELEEELDYYEDNDEEGDDCLDMDKVLRKCPPTEVLQNLRDMVQLSKNTTSQLEKALRKAARISCGPFPRLPGSGMTKSEVIESKCAKLVSETEDFLGDINKNFLTFYTVLEQMDKVGAQQDSFVSSILVKKGPRDWRRGHAAILRKMDKLWSRDYPKVITRKLKGSIQETIYEEDEE